MGHTLQPLASKPLPKETIFNNRFTIELCEKVHIHYRNIRLNLSMRDWKEICRGFVDAYRRWNERGCPETKEGQHIELCRKQVGNDVQNDGIKVNLNYNLYLSHEGKIFADGAGFKEETYIHLKIRDVRFEMPILEFKELANAIKEAEKRLENSCNPASI